jgi:hypothetical protein
VLPGSAALALDSVAVVPQPPAAEQYVGITELPAVARMLHAAYATEDPWMVDARAAYLRNLEAVIAAGAVAVATPVGLGRMLVSAYGTELFAGAR